MSEFITAENIDLVIKKNREIKDEVLAQAVKLQENPAIMKVASASQLALLVLQRFGLVQMSIEVKKRKDENPELWFHKDNEEFLGNIMKEMDMITRRK